MALSSLGFEAVDGPDFASMVGLLTTWDHDEDGLVTAAEFKTGLQNLGFNISQVFAVVKNNMAARRRADLSTRSSLIPIISRTHSRGRHARMQAHTRMRTS